MKALMRMRYNHACEFAPDPSRPNETSVRANVSWIRSSASARLRVRRSAVGYI